MTSASATQDSYLYQKEPIWSRSEKAVARRAFDAALKRELHHVRQETKQMANQINEPVVRAPRKEPGRRYLCRDGPRL
jgi:hypothetical protein